MCDVPIASFIIPCHAHVLAVGMFVCALNSYSQWNGEHGVKRFCPATHLSVTKIYIIHGISPTASSDERSAQLWWVVVVYGFIPLALLPFKFIEGIRPMVERLMSVLFSIKAHREQSWNGNSVFECRLTMPCVVKIHWTIEGRVRLRWTVSAKIHLWSIRA